MIMITTGILRVSSGVSRINGTRLAIVGDPNPFGAATNFLANRGLSPNQLIRVDGNNDFVGSVPVINVLDARPAGAGATKALTAGAGKAGRAAAGRSAGRKGGTKKAAKKAAKKSAKKAAKKSAKRVGKKAAKKPAKRSASKKSGRGSRKRQ